MWEYAANNINLNALCENVGNVYDANQNVAFDVLKAVIMKTSMFWELVPCSQIKANRYVGEYITSIFRVEEYVK
jgi:hypothetical protein